MAHSPQFLKLVNESKTRVKETNVEEVKRCMDAGEKFLLVDVREDNEWANGHLPRAVHMGRGSGHRHKNDSLLRRRLSLRACSRQSAENGIYQCRIDGRRLEGLGGGGVADYERLDPVLNRSGKSTIVACLNMPCAPS